MCTLIAIVCLILTSTGCDHRPQSKPETEHAGSAVRRQNENATVPTRTLSGIVEVDKLPSHFGLSVNLVFFPVSDADDPAPHNGDPPADAVTDSDQLYNEVDLDIEIVDSKRTIPFSLSKLEGYYYIQVRILLYRKQGNKLFAQGRTVFLWAASTAID